MLLDLLTSTYFSSLNGTLNGVNGKGGKSHPRNKRAWAKAYVCYVEVSNARLSSSIEAGLVGILSSARAARMAANCSRHWFSASFNLLDVMAAAFVVCVCVDRK